MLNWGMRRVVIAVAAAVLSAACLEVRTDPATALGQPFQLKPQKSAFVSGGLILTFDSVLSDSRCPINATCVWAGEARVALTASTRSRGRAKVEMSTHGDASTLSFGGFIIRLTELQPYPFAGHPTPPGDYVVTLVVDNP